MGEALFYIEYCKKISPLAVHQISVVEVDW